MRIEAHLLQNFAPSCLNRDDTNSPKDAEFGGYRRARISSQCIKRAVRRYFDAHTGLVPAASRARRTKRLLDLACDRLKAKGKTSEAAAVAVTAALAGAGLRVGDDRLTEYLLFLGETEVDGFVTVVEDHWDALSAGPAAAGNGEGAPPAEPEPAADLAKKTKRRTAKQAKADARAAVAPEVVKAVTGLLDGGKAADLALFGRMLADRPSANVDAACQVAHAISTNKVHGMELDYYTAVDEIKPEDTPGADMIGTVEFNSSCFYRYATLDTKLLTDNLQKDEVLAEKAARAFLAAFVNAVPTGKQNTFAAHNPPSVVFLVARTGAPVSLANAFVKPVAPRGGEDLVVESATALDRYYGRVVAMYGDGGLKAAALCALDDFDLSALGKFPATPTQGQACIDAAIDRVVGAAFPAGGAK